MIAVAQETIEKEVASPTAIISDILNKKMVLSEINGKKVDNEAVKIK
nr:hypothetical protein [uncultured Flavobacterium sp.]